MTYPTSDQGTNLQALLEWLTSLFTDAEARAAFGADPKGALEATGFADDLTAQDVSHTLPIALERCGFDRSYDTGGNEQYGGGTYTGGDYTPPPPPEPYPGESELETIIRYVTNVTNYYSVDDRDTIVDNSVNQHIDTDGGDLDQTFDNDPTVVSGDGSDATVASGDGSVAAGRDITGDVVAGGGDVNTGSITEDDHSTIVKFGEGDVSDTQINVQGGEDNRQDSTQSEFPFFGFPAVSSVGDEPEAEPIRPLPDRDDDADDDTKDDHSTTVRFGEGNVSDSQINVQGGEDNTQHVRQFEAPEFDERILRAEEPADLEATKLVEGEAEAQVPEQPEPVEPIAVEQAVQTQPAEQQVEA